MAYIAENDNPEVSLDYHRASPARDARFRATLLPDNSVVRRLGLSLILFLTAQAQTNAQSLVPFDPEGKVLILDSSFPSPQAVLGVSDIHDARILAATDSTWTLEMTRKNESGLFREFRTLSRAELTALRERYLQSVKGERPVNRSGDVSANTAFVRTFSALGFAWYGWTLPVLVDDSKAGLALYLLTAGGCYFFADGYAQAHSLSSREVFAFQYFSSRGIVHGLSLTTAVMGTDTDIRAAFPLSTIASLTEGFVSMSVVRSSRITEGRLGGIAANGDAGLLSGLAVSYLLADGNPPILENIGDEPRRYAVGTLAGNLVGLLAGTALSSDDRYSEGDSPVQETVGYLGATAGFLAGDVASNQERKDLVLFSLGGFVLGHILGYNLAGSYDFSGEEGNRVRLLTSGGIFLGLGFTEVFAKEGSDRTPYLIGALLGGSLGLTYALSSTAPSSQSLGSGAEIIFDPTALSNPLHRIPATLTLYQRPALTFRFSW